uniref:DUF1018 domain-containing protein n=1 Tax=Geobacter sp. (strain M21) TaxID=443144 RepID=C6E6S8_GEOSM
MTTLKQCNYRKFSKLPINGKQKTVIKMAVTALGIGEADYRDMLEERYGVRSCTKLSFNQASEFIKELEGKGFTLRPGKKPGGKVATPRPATPRPPISRSGGKIVGLATQGEKEKVDQLAELIKWREENGLQLFLEKRMGIKGGKIRTSQEAYLAIEGLKKMFANGMKKAYGAEWWVMPYTDPKINEFIRIHKPAEWR